MLQKKQWGFKTKKEAQEALIKAENEVLNGTYVEPSKILFGDFLREWLKHKQHTIKEQTSINYYHVANKIIPKLGNLQLRHVTSHVIQKFMNEIRDDNLSDSYMHKLYAIIYSSMFTAVKLDLLSKNPAEAAEPPRI